MVRPTDRHPVSDQHRGGHHGRPEVYGIEGLDPKDDIERFPAAAGNEV